VSDWERPGASVVVVTTPTCPNCTAMKPVVEATARAFEGRVAVVALDAATDPARAADLGIRGVPTYVARTDGAEVMRRVGRMSATDLDGLFTAAIEGVATSVRMSRGDRALRLVVAGAFAVAGLATSTPALLVLGGVVGVFGVWDLLTGR